MFALTEKQKSLYNKHLIISRQCRNKPFKPKKDFTDVTPQAYTSICRIENLLNKFPNVEPDVYFKAPYSLWPDTQYFPLEYFSTQAALRAFTLYKKQLLEQDVDSEQTLNEIKNSLMFICKFCVDNKIQLTKYYTHKSSVSFTWAKHVRSGLICPYVVFGFDDIDNIVFNMPEDESDLLLGSFKEKYYNYKNSFNKSKTAKHTVNEGLKRIKKWINDELSG